MPVVHDMAMNNWQTKQYQQGHQQEEQWSLQQDQQMEQPFVIGTWGQPSEPQGPRQQWAAQETFQAWPSDGGKIFFNSIENSVLKSSHVF